MSQKSCHMWDVEVSNSSLHFFLSFFLPSYDSKWASAEFPFWNYPLSWLQTPKGYNSSSLIRFTFGVSCSSVWGVPSKGIASQVCFAFLGKNAFHYVFHFILDLNISVKCIKVQSRAVGFLCLVAVSKQGGYLGDQWQAFGKSLKQYFKCVHWIRQMAITENLDFQHISSTYFILVFERQHCSFRYSAKSGETNIILPTKLRKYTFWNQFFVISRWKRNVVSCYAVLWFAGTTCEYLGGIPWFSLQFRQIWFKETWSFEL